MWIKIVFLIGILCISNVRSRSGGAPLESCDDMMPQHGVNLIPQETPFPISFEAPITFISGAPVVIKLKSDNNLLNGFRGFLIQARTAESNELIGTFIASNQVQVMACSEIPGSAATHTDRSEKFEVDITWIAPEISSEFKTFNFL